MCFSSAAIYVTLLAIGLRIVSLLKQRNDIMYDQYQYNNKRPGISSDDSKKFHEFIKFIITETAVIKFKKYLMNNDISKTNRSNIQHLISDIATEVYDALQNTDEIFDDHNLLDETYYQRYITDLSIITVEKLLDDML